MQLLLKSADGSLRRPAEIQPTPDFGAEGDGSLVVVDAGVVSELGIHLLAGDDTDPPTHYAYEAELYAWSGRLVLRAVQRRTSSSLLLDLPSAVIEWRVSEDGGRSWRTVGAPVPLDELQLLDRIAAG